MEVALESTVYEFDRYAAGCAICYWIAKAAFCLCRFVECALSGLSTLRRRCRFFEKLLCFKCSSKSDFGEKLRFCEIFSCKNLQYRKIVVPLHRFTKQGRLAQLVQSICLTSRGSAVRIRQRPHTRSLFGDLFYFCSMSLLFRTALWPCG